MIAVVLHDMRWRLALLLPIGILLYALEPGFHQHDELDLGAVALGPLGVSATLAYLAGLSMIVLTAGVVSRDRRLGYSKIFFSHPTSPTRYYALRWGIAYLAAFLAAVAFLVIGQVVAWGGVLGGWMGLTLPAATALIYGGLVGFFSSVLPKGDAWVAFLLFLPTFFPQILTLGLAGTSPAVRQAILLLLPPQGALQRVWEGLLVGSFDWGALAFSLSYGAVFLVAAVVILRLREWP